MSLGFLFTLFALLLLLGYALAKYFARPKQLLAPYYPDMKFTTVDGFRIPYVQRGHGKKHVVMVHGLAASMYCWRHIIEPLAKTHTVTIFDLPGFGDADKHIDKSYTLDSQCARITQLLDQLKIDKTSVIAHSMGGAIALHLAKCQPERVEKLILIAPAIDPEMIAINPQYLMWNVNLVKNFIVTPALVKWINRRSISEDMRWEDVTEITFNYYRPYHRSGAAVVTLLKHYELLKDPRPSNSEPVKTPTLILYSQKDRLLRMKTLEKYRHQHPEIRFVEDKISAHQMMEENPSFVLKHVTHFLLD